MKRNEYIKWILFLYFANIYSSHCFGQDLDTVLNSLAQIRAEAEVRHFHLMNTPTNNKDRTLKKLETLERKERALAKKYQSLIDIQTQDAIDQQSESLHEIYAFSEKVQQICKQNEEIELCKANGITNSLQKIIIAFSEDPELYKKLPSTLNENDSLVLSPTSIIKYSSNYDVSFSKEGYVICNIEITGSFERKPSKSELETFNKKISRDIETSTSIKLNKLIKTFQIKFMGDKKLIEANKKKRIIGTF